MIYPVYVAAPWEDGAFVSMAVHPRLASMGCYPTSTWATYADGSKEDLTRLTVEASRAALEANDRDIRRACAVLLLARHGAGSACFGEVRYALALGKPVVWSGERVNIDVRRPGVIRAETLDEALEAVARLRDAHEVRA